MKTSWFTVLCLVVLVLAGCNSPKAERDFYLCLRAVSVAHPDEFGSIIDIRRVAGKDIGNAYWASTSRNFLSICIKGKTGDTYPEKDPAWYPQNTFLVTWLDKLGNTHLSAVRMGKDVILGPIVLLGPGPEAEKESPHTGL